MSVEGVQYVHDDASVLGSFGSFSGSPAFPDFCFASNIALTAIVDRLNFGELATQVAAPARLGAFPIPQLTLQALQRPSIS